MSKGKRQQSTDASKGAAFGSPSPYPRWWFEDQHEMNRLIVDAVVGHENEKSDLKRASDFLYNGYAHLGQLIPETLAKSTKNPTGSTIEACSAVAAYPTVLKCLEFFAGDDKLVKSSKKEEDDLILYVAASNTGGIRTGEVIAADAFRPWKWNGDTFFGMIMAYKIVKDV